MGPTESTSWLSFSVGLTLRDSSIILSRQYCVASIELHLLLVHFYKIWTGLIMDCSFDHCCEPIGRP